MNSDEKKEIAISKIEGAIDELSSETNFEQAAILVGRVKGFLELSFAIDLLSQEELKVFSDKFAAVRAELAKRLPQK